MTASGTGGSSTGIDSMSGMTQAAAGTTADMPKMRSTTAADRQAAADRAKVAGVQTPQTAAMDPLGTPDYFGTIPNYANSPLPTQNGEGPDFNWPWYDSQNMRNWVLIANTSGANYTSFNLSIAGQDQPLGNPFGFGTGVIPGGKTLPYMSPGLIGGPVKATPSTWGDNVVSQRSLLGSSFEEVPGTESSKLSDHFYWTWIDGSTPGYRNWVLVNNPSATETVHAIISYTPMGSTTPETLAESDIAAGQNWNPEFPGKIGGPVEVKVAVQGGDWNNTADRRPAMASQRVTTNFGTTFNEVPGIPAGDLSGDYLWTWYDMQSPGFRDWILIANPDQSNAVNYEIKIGGTLVDTGSIPANTIITPTFPGRMNGPVEVTATGNVIASQRSIIGPSFEEVPGKPQSQLSMSYAWTWYDMKNPGTANWVLISNPDPVNAVGYSIKIGGVDQACPSGGCVIPPNSRVIPTFPGEINGPVEVSASGKVMASQRVVWNGYFNEVLGTGRVLQGTGIRKFVDSLPGLSAATANDLGQYTPTAVPDTTTYPGPTPPASDYYEIAEVQYTQKLHADLPATTLRGYVQIETPANVGVSHHIALTYPDGSPILQGGNQVYAVDKPSYMGPAIVAQQDKPVRVKFYNFLPTGTGGDLFLPVDSTIMGAGEGDKHADGSACDQSVENCASYTENRANIHLHGGDTVWISDGTPNQWITPAGETTPYPEGVQVVNVPDMPAPTPGDGTRTFFYSNEHSARLMFYHDHDYGITRLNVYSGAAAPYVVNDAVEQSLVSNGIIPSDQVPLVIQDKTFVPDTAQLEQEDPTWDISKWGGKGNLWFPHVYMPNQNPFDSSGANAMGRWDYGPWFWPPFTGLINGPVANPLYGQSGEPPQNPGTPNPSAVPEAFMDTPLVNGTAYPYMQVGRKAYRFRILNASNDRFINLQMYYAKSNSVDAVNPATGGPSLQKASGEVNMVPADPNFGLPASWPTDSRDGGAPDPNAAGPKFIQIGNEGGFLPGVSVIDNTPVGYIYNRRDITVLNVANKSLFLGPAERADVIVDFSQVPDGSKIILYNDAPAPVPGFDPRNDYYTGNPDMISTGGAPTTVSGYGPNTRTMMQFQVAGPASAPFNVAALETALPTAYGQTQPAPIVPQASYNAAFGKAYPADAYSRIQDTSMTFFNGPLYDSINSFTVNNGGSGYSATPSVEITGGGGTGAYATATVAGGAITGVTIVDPGSGYTSAPDVMLVDPTGSGASVTASLASAIKVTNSGSGYSSPPAVSITGGDGSGATATSTIDIGGVTWISLTNAGHGYVTAPNVIISAPGGGGTTATATATISSGIVTGITITNRGSGYTSAPTVSFSGGGGADAAASALISGVTGITMTNRGTGFTSAPTVTIAAPGGGGATATATAAGLTMGMRPKSIIEDFETNYGRMNALLGVEIPHTNITNQTSIIQKYIDPPTEEVKNIADLATPIGTEADGTQIWKITHNGVDTHAVHVHLFDVQVINRVGWDGAVKPPDANELGWKETVRMNPLEDIIVAFRPHSPANVPFAVPDSVRKYDVTMPTGSGMQFTNVDQNGNPITVTNQLFNFGWEYVWHCHLLGHEENDMMRPIMVRGSGLDAPSALNATPSAGTAALTWTNNPVVPGAARFIVQRATDAGFTTNVASIEVSGFPVPAAYTDTGLAAGTYYYRVRAENSVSFSAWSNVAGPIVVP
ncbi:MAG: cupredoxin domain-containing protein [Thermoleophilia bacterium]